MQKDDFLILLAEQGFGVTALVERKPFDSLDDHTHPFEAKALVLRGELTIRTLDLERTYRAGDVFHLQPEQPHSEVFGAQGVQYLVGRR